MKKIIIYLLTFLYSFDALANLSVSDFFVLFDANSPKRSEVIRVSNSSNQKKTYRINLINFKQNPDGTYTEISTPIKNNPFASPYVDFSPRETSLKAGETQTIRLIRKPMAAAPDGEYVSHLWIRELPDNNLISEQKTSNNNELKINLKALYGVTIPVIIEKGELKSSATIGNISTNNANSPYLEVTVKRTGNQSFWGNLIVMQGKKEIGRVNQFKIFMTTPERKIRIPLEENIKSQIRVILEDARTNEQIFSKTI